MEFDYVVDRLIKSLSRERIVVVVDDIIDSGATLDAICKGIRERSECEIIAAPMIYKQAHSMSTRIRFAPREPFWLPMPDLPPNQTVPCVAGFELSNGPFIIGYGLDYKGQYRDLDYIAEYLP